MIANTHDIEPTIPQTELPSKLGNAPLFKRDNYFVDESIDFHGGSQKRTGIKLALWSWMSAFIDALVLISMSCFALIFISVSLKTFNADLLKSISSELTLVKMFSLTFLFSFWVYLVAMRTFMGATLGEWSCQLRLGQPVQRMKNTYVLKVMARTSLILVTGIITIPIISLIFDRDLVGELTGVKTYSLL